MHIQWYGLYFFLQWGASPKHSIHLLLLLLLRPLCSTHCGSLVQKSHHWLINIKKDTLCCCPVVVFTPTDQNSVAVSNLWLWLDALQSRKVKDHMSNTLWRQTPVLLWWNSQGQNTHRHTLSLFVLHFSPLRLYHFLFFSSGWLSLVRPHWCSVLQLAARPALMFLNLLFGLNKGLSRCGSLCSFCTKPSRDWGCIQDPRATSAQCTTKRVWTVKCWRAKHIEKNNSIEFTI